METVVATAAVKNAIDATLPHMLNVAIRSVKYPFDVGANVKALQSAMNDLLAKREDVNTKIENGERQGEKVTKEVSGWIDQVEAIKTKVEEIEQRYQARYKCLGSYSFNCRLNYTISKSAVKTLLDVQRLYTKPETYESVTMPVPPPDVQEVPMEPITSSTSDDNLAHALECINNGHVGVIGLVGMGGVGKTCLLQRINNNYTQNPNNFKVVLVTASQECSIAKLQSSIAEKLNLATRTNEDQQAIIIFNFLKENNFLLLLDDLWDGFDLKKVGIPFPLGLGEKYNRKVVLTTRLSQVCGQMGVGKEIGVACLNDKESWSLFREKVGNDTLDSHPLILSLAKKVIDQLGGLPLALIIIGSVMYGKRDPRDWNYAIDQIRSPNSGSEESLYHRLKFSYENLRDETLKKCFLSCSLSPEDYNIDRNKLIRRWIGLDYIKESDMQKAHDLGHTIISTLLRQNLLEEMLDDYNCSEVVKMHDVIRSMALWIACGFGVSKNKWVIKAGVGLRESPINNKELWCDAECVSLMHNRITEFKCPPLSFPSNLTTLMLNGNENLKCFYPKPLTRLRYLDLSNNRIYDFPLEICDLVDLQHLDLSSNYIESIPVELKSLINLRFLYFTHNNIRYFPEGVISGLKSLEVLDFYYCHVKMIFEPYFFEEIKCLENLKTLGITVCNLSDLEKFKVLSTSVAIRSLLLNLKFSSTSLSSTSLSSTSICSTETESHLVKLHIKNNRFKEFVIETKQFPYLEELNLVSNETLEEVMWRGVLPMNVFPRLRMLFIFHCGMEHLTWIVHLPFLHTLRVHSCFYMKELVRDDQEGKNTTTCFPSLKIMKLSNMVNLESICDPNFAFPSLRIVRIDRCPKLKKLPFASQFSQLGPAVLPTAGSVHSSSGVEKKLESLPGMVSGVDSEDATLQLEAMTQFRKLLSTEESPPIEEVIQAGVVPRFVQFLTRENYPELQSEAAWALGNIAYLNTKVVIDYGAVPIFVKLLGSSSDDVRETAMWVLGNVAGDSPRCRDLVLANGALLPLLAQLNQQAELPMLRKVTRTLSNFCSGKPQPQFGQTKSALSALARLIHSDDEEVLTHTCRALLYLSDGTNDKIQAVIDAGVCPRLVELLTHPSPSVLIPALRTVGNIVSGDDLQTQCIIDHQALPCLLNLLTQNHEKEACWIISHITAHNKDQLTQAVIAAGILGPLINLLQTAGFDIKKDAAWALSNATFGCTHDQIKYLVNQGCIKPLCDLLICPDPLLVRVCLNGLENILKVGEAEKNLGATGNVNLFAQMIDEAEGLEKIKNLQSHDEKEICEQAVKILETYWLEDEDDGMGAVDSA